MAVTRETLGVERPPRSAMLAAAAALASGACVYLGTGLHPVAAVTWLALLPVLLVAPRVPWGWAAAAAAAAWVAGESGFWSYFAGPLDTPLPILVGVLTIHPLLAVGSTALFRVLVRRDRLVAAMLAVPAVWVAGEYVVSVSQPHGAWLGLGYTQADVAPVLQLAAVTGAGGMTWLVTWLPAALAALAAPGAGRRRAPVIAATILVLTVVSGYAAVRLLAPPTGPTIRVAVVGGPVEAELRPGTPEGRSQLAEYQRQIVGPLTRGRRWSSSRRRCSTPTNARGRCSTHPSRDSRPSGTSRSSSAPRPGWAAPRRTWRSRSRRPGARRRPTPSTTSSRAWKAS